MNDIKVRLKPTDANCQCCHCVSARKEQAAALWMAEAWLRAEMKACKAAQERRRELRGHFVFFLIMLGVAVAVGLALSLLPALWTR